jgi:hypothetical protein
MDMTEKRFPQLTVDQLDERQRPLGEEIMKISKVGIAGPYNPMLRSPVFGQRMFDLLAYLAGIRRCRSGSTSSRSSLSRGNGAPRSSGLRTRLLP